MSTDLTEEEMRRALFGGPAPTEQVSTQTVKTLPTKKATKAFTCRLKVTMQVGNEFEGQTFELTYEADTLSTLLAEQEAVKIARKKYRYVEVVSVKSM